jgi:hypothetical protein
MTHFKKYFLIYTLLPLLTLAISASYYRFMVLYTYEIAYEVACDTEKNSCFILCEGEDCSNPTYYKKVRRVAKEFLKVCGEKSVTECQEANYCKEGEIGCVIEYCDQETGVCSSSVGITK